MSGERKSTGRLFHTAGPLTEKLRYSTHKTAGHLEVHISLLLGLFRSSMTGCNVNCNHVFN